MYFPQSSPDRAGPSNKQKKAFLLSLFKKTCLIWSIHMVSREMDETMWTGPVILLFADAMSGSKVCPEYGHVFSYCQHVAPNHSHSVSDATAMTTAAGYSKSSSCILYQYGALTQVCIVWSFINVVSAVGICGGLWCLDPNREVTTFSICLAPPASKNRDIMKRTSY